MSIPPLPWETASAECIRKSLRTICGHIPYLPRDVQWCFPSRMPSQRTSAQMEWFSEDKTLVVRCIIGKPAIISRINCKLVPTGNPWRKLLLRKGDRLRDQGLEGEERSSVSCAVTVGKTPSASLEGESTRAFTLLDKYDKFCSLRQLAR